MQFSWAGLFRPAPLLGLDIGNAALRLVELSFRPDRGFRLERFACLPLPAGTITDGRIHHPDQLAGHIGNLLQACGTRRKYVALALPAHAVITRQMLLPPGVSDGVLYRLMTTEASRYLSVAAADVCVDYQFEQAPGTDLECAVLLAAARKEQVEDRLAAVAAAGLTAEILDIDVYAAYAACHRIATAAAAAAAGHSALLIVGASQSHIALFDRNQLLFQRELPGSDGSGDRNSDSNTLALAASRALALAGTQAEQVYLGGELAVLPELAQQLFQRSGIPCTLADPFEHMSMSDGAPTPPCSPAEGAAYLVACGLAIRSGTVSP